MAARIGTWGWIGIGTLIAASLAAGLVFAWIILNSRDGTGVVRDFLDHGFAGRSAEAHAMTSPGLQARMTEADLAADFAARAPLLAIRFGRIMTTGNNRTRTTWLDGHGTTAGGCPTAFTVEIRNGRIEDYAFDPGCPAEPE